MRRSWRMLQLGVNTGTDQFVTSVLTANDADDGA